MRPVYRIVIVVENDVLPDTLIYDIRKMISTFLPDANIVVREGDNTAYYVVEAHDGKNISTGAAQADDEVRRIEANSGSS